jgi:hypothetical protein
MLAPGARDAYGRSVRAATSKRERARRTASRLLRGAADQLQPPRRTRPRRAIAPLVRLGGRWFHRDELVPMSSEEDAADVQLLP